MTIQENSIGAGAGNPASNNPPLSQVTAQMSWSSGPRQSGPADEVAKQPSKPQVVFVEQQTPTQLVQQIVEIRIPTTQNVAPVQVESVNVEQISSEPELVSDSEPARPLHSIPGPADQDELNNLPVVHAVRMEESESKSVSRFAVDPFDYATDGPIPVMPTLPIVKAKEMTDKVVAREQKGNHYAWRLLPVPYPTEGNIPSTVDDSNKAISVADQSEPAVNGSPQSPIANSAIEQIQAVQASGHGPVVFDELPKMRSVPAAIESWTETEVVAEENDSDHGDCFFAQSGDVIKIDGNQGFDHIDLRSYSIDDATFQPGAILLHSNLDSADEGEQQPAPITIRHRGVAFAIFKGEVRVEL